MKVSTFMKPADKAAALPPSATIGDAAARMHAEKVGSIVIVEGGVAVGIVTKSDIVAAYVGGVAPTASVSSVMAKGLVTCALDTQRDAAAEMMTKVHKHHLIVLGEGGVFAGIVSSMDIAKEVILDAKAYPYSRESLAAMFPSS
eukprot:TRINITY_DN58197_c0_g1_i1.p1 TRINITY_DN58197_c0_g1~~TRINITY_DN58197_c0_g1_i1.p1  ORF type:complete len:162 (-),score=34.65 TRINITY_DN58197_c0_g1_i1:422-853(-)